MRFLRSALVVFSTALISPVASAAEDPLSNPARHAGVWKTGLQQKTCAAVGSRESSPGRNVLNVWNTDGSVLQVSNRPGGVANFAVASPAEALMTAACTPNLSVPAGRKYWVAVDNPHLGVPHPTTLIVTYPPTDTPPVFNRRPQAGLWTTGLQQKICAAIEWHACSPLNLADCENLHVHNADDSVYGSREFC